MARIPREELVSDTQPGVYLCTMKALEGKRIGGGEKGSKSFDHRRKWIVEQIELQGAQMGVEVLAYSVLTDRLSLVLRTRPDLVKEWGDADVARRYQTALYAKVPFAESRRTPPEAEIAAMQQTKVELRRGRSRLSNLTWFVGQLSESIARNCNREDGTKGKFWEGRYQCLPILDATAALAAIAHVDLEPIFTGETTTVAGCKFSSAKPRISGGKGGALTLTGSDSPAGGKAKEPPGTLAVTNAEAQKLVEWTAKQTKRVDVSKLPDELAGVFGKVGVGPDAWVKLVRDYRELFHRAAGTVESLEKLRKKRGLRHLHGLVAARELFSK